MPYCLLSIPSQHPSKNIHTTSLQKQQPSTKPKAAKDYYGGHCSSSNKLWSITLKKRRRTRQASIQSNQPFCPNEVRLLGESMPLQSTCTKPTLSIELKQAPAPKILPEDNPSTLNSSFIAASFQPQL
uniref:Uncharacterized protein n=1 Tax=Ditylenchus dipsaci TaxID=166011 RepID=A0A915EGV2_9BILA